jgi:L-2-hydroxyglutarate oxidase LhgO
MEHLDTIVIGAGVVGLACARALAQEGREVMVLEAADAIGTGTSARNSEVIHAGLYYPPGSLKAQMCVEGREALYAYASERGIAHRQCGKLIVATHADQHARLQAILEQSRANGLTSGDALQWLNASQAQALEPDLHCTAALLSPRTGIIDSHALMLALQGDLEHAGGQVVLNTEVIGIELHPDHPHVLNLATGAEHFSIAARTIINCAGLHAVRLTQHIKGWPSGAPPSLPPARFAKGDYFSLQARAPFSHLIYPVPEPGGLGIHLTLDLAGRARFGPDVTWLPEDTDPASLDYSVDPAKAHHFAHAIRNYWPTIAEHQLQADYSGVRPKLSGPTDPAADFMILDSTHHGVTGLLLCLGIESPGLTSALAIGQYILKAQRRR